MTKTRKIGSVSISGQAKTPTKHVGSKRRTTATNSRDNTNKSGSVIATTKRYELRSNSNPSALQSDRSEPFEPRSVTQEDAREGAEVVAKAKKKQRRRLDAEFAQQEDEECDEEDDDGVPKDSRRKKGGKRITAAKKLATTTSNAKSKTKAKRKTSKRTKGTRVSSTSVGANKGYETPSNQKLLDVFAPDDSSRHATTPRKDVDATNNDDDKKKNAKNEEEDASKKKIEKCTEKEAAKTGGSFAFVVPRAPMKRNVQQLLRNDEETPKEEGMFFGEESKNAKRNSNNNNVAKSPLDGLTTPKASFAGLVTSRNIFGSLKTTPI